MNFAAILSKTTENEPNFLQINYTKQCMHSEKTLKQILLMMASSVETHNTKSSFQSVCFTEQMITGAEFMPSSLRPGLRNG